MGGEGAGKKLVLVIKERVPKMLMETLVPKNMSWDFAARRTRLNAGGRVRSDRRHRSERQLAGDRRRRRYGGLLRAAASVQPMAVETSLAHASASNPVVERGVQSVRGLRVSRSATEAALGVQIQVGHAIRPWLSQ